MHAALLPFLLAMVFAATTSVGQDKAIEVRATVLDVDGVPVAGAAFHFGRRSELGGGAEQVGPVARTDAAGRLLARAPVKVGELFGLLVADGHASRLMRIAKVATTSGAGTRLNGRVDLGVVRLDAAREMRGLVRDAKGKPVEGAQIEVMDVLAARHIMLRSRGYTGLGNSAFGRSSAKGSFRLTHVQRRAVAVFVRKSGYYVTHLRYADPQQPLVITLHRGGQVRGRFVQADGKPAPATRFAIYYETEDDLENCITDAEGRFAVDLAHQGRYRIGVMAVARGVKKQFSKVLDGPTDGVEFTIPKSTSVDVRVVDTEGKPVPRFRAVAAWMTIRPGLSIDAVANSNYNRLSMPQTRPGRVTLPGPSGKVLRQGFIHARAPGFAPKTLLVDLDAVVPGSAKGDCDFILQLSPGGRVTGICRDKKSGKPRAGIGVEVTRVTEAKLPVAKVRVVPFAGIVSGARVAPVQVVTGADGRFRLDQLAPGKYRVQLPTKTWPSAPAHTVEVALGKQTADIELSVPAGVTVGGRLVGAPLQKSWSVALVRKFGIRRANPFLQISMSLARPAVLDDFWPMDAEGGFRIGGVQPGGYLLVLNAPQTGGGVVQTEIAKLEVGKQAFEKDFSIAAAHPGILRGKVSFDQMHLPSGRLLLALENASRRPSPFPMALGARLTGPKTVVAANGSFEIHAAPGEYRLLAMDLATGVLLHQSEDSVNIKAGKTTASRLEISLAFARITLAPVASGGRMARVSRLQVEVDLPVNQPNVRVGAALVNFDRGHGLLLAPGQEVVELFLPCFETRVLARSAAYHLVGMGFRVRAPALGEIEFLPNPAKTTKVVLPIGPPTDY